MIVLDASAAVSVLLNSDAGAPRIRKRMGRADNELHVPHLFEIEVMNVLRHYALGGILSPERARIALVRLSTLKLTRYPHTPLLSRIWELRDNMTPYDAAYVALAETLDAPLVTRDERLSKAPGVRATVEVFGQKDGDSP